MPAARRHGVAGGAKRGAEVRGFRGACLYKGRLAEAVAASSPGWRGRALRMVEDGLHGVLTSYAFDLICRDRYHNWTESRWIVPAVIGVGAEYLEVVPGERYRLSESTIGVALSPDARDRGFWPWFHKARIWEGGVL